MSKAWANGSTAWWRRKRLQILQRDRWTCRRCGTGLDPNLPRKHPRSPQVHHTLGKTVTGDGDDRYLESTCRQCNLSIGDPTKGPDPAPRPVTKW